ncbi:hypothetical protein FBU59_001239 [Linderina macrospora]|uniref:Uncharacterized protein n=1 Tax=Linderina macrospora TaxID=4868 RepID=A0ACC1JET6_9FUNG|nr:hypothetical protein FBU59_001239 [Linderina macrospora]
MEDYRSSGSKKKSKGFKRSVLGSTEKSGRSHHNKFRLVPDSVRRRWLGGKSDHKTASFEFKSSLKAPQANAPTQSLAALNTKIEPDYDMVSVPSTPMAMDPPQPVLDMQPGKLFSQQKLRNEVKNSRRVTIDAFPAAIKRHLRGNSAKEGDASVSAASQGGSGYPADTADTPQNSRLGNKLWVDTSMVHNTIAPASAALAGMPSRLDGQWSAYSASLGSGMTPRSAMPAFQSVPQDINPLGRSVSQQHFGISDIDFSSPLAPLRPRPVGANQSSPSSSQTNLGSYPSKLRDAMATLRLLRMSNDKSKTSLLSDMSDGHDVLKRSATEIPSVNPHSRLQSRISMPLVPTAAQILSFEERRQTGVVNSPRSQPHELSAMHILTQTPSLPSIRTAPSRDYGKPQHYLHERVKTPLSAHLLVPISPLEQRREKTLLKLSKHAINQTTSVPNNWSIQEVEIEEDKPVTPNAVGNKLGLVKDSPPRVPRRSVSYSNHEHGRAVELSAQAAGRALSSQQMRALGGHTRTPSSVTGQCPSMSSIASASSTASVTAVPSQQQIAQEVSSDEYVSADQILSTAVSGSENDIAGGLTVSASVIPIDMPRRSTACAPLQPASVSSSLALVSESAPDPSPPYQMTPPLLSRHARAASLLPPEIYSHSTPALAKSAGAPSAAVVQGPAKSTPNLELYHPVIGVGTQDGCSHWHGEFVNVANNLVDLLDALDSDILALTASS